MRIWTNPSDLTPQEIDTIAAAVDPKYTFGSLPPNAVPGVALNESLATHPDFPGLLLKKVGSTGELLANGWGFMVWQSSTQIEAHLGLNAEYVMRGGGMLGLGSSHQTAPLRTIAATGKQINSNHDNWSNVAVGSCSGGGTWGNAAGSLIAPADVGLAYPVDSNSNLFGICAVLNPVDGGYLTNDMSPGLATLSTGGWLGSKWQAGTFGQAILAAKADLLSGVPTDHGVADFFWSAILTRTLPYASEPLHMWYGGQMQADKTMKYGHLTPTICQIGLEAGATSNPFWGCPDSQSYRGIPQGMALQPLSAGIPLFDDFYGACVLSQVVQAVTHRLVEQSAPYDTIAGATLPDAFKLAAKNFITAGLLESSTVNSVTEQAPNPDGTATTVSVGTLLNAGVTVDPTLAAVLGPLGLDPIWVPVRLAVQAAYQDTENYVKSLS